MKAYTLKTFREALRPLAHYQTAANDVSGHERDVEWWTKAKRARTWAAMAEAVPTTLNPWHAIACQGGHRP